MYSSVPPSLAALDQLLRNSRFGFLETVTITIIISSGCGEHKEPACALILPTHTGPMEIDTPPLTAALWVATIQQPFYSVTFPRKSFRAEKSRTAPIKGTKTHPAFASGTAEMCGSP
jgi:hypothetical protein